MSTLDEIDNLTKDLADSRVTLGSALRKYDVALAKVRAAHIDGVKDGAADVAEKTAALEDAIESSRDLFKSPKTKVLHGIKVGLRKANGVFSWDDDETLIKRIRNKLSKDEQAAIINTTTKVEKKPLGKLPAAMLKKLGVTVSNVADKVVVSPVKSDLDKLAEALLKEDAP